MKTKIFQNLTVVALIALVYSSSLHGGLTGQETFTPEKMAGKRYDNPNPVSAKVLKKLQKKGYAVVDVRSKEAFATCHIKGAINVTNDDNLGPNLHALFGNKDENKHETKGKNIIFYGSSDTNDAYNAAMVVILENHAAEDFMAMKSIPFGQIATPAMERAMFYPDGMEGWQKAFKGKMTDGAECKKK